MNQTFTPHDYQREMMDWVLDNRRCGVWAPMGGGKSVSTLTALNDLSLVEDVFPALILAPLRVANSTWPNEVEKWSHLSHLRVSALASRSDPTASASAQERLAALRTPADIYTMPYDNLQWLREALGDEWPFRTIIADECFPAGTPVSIPQGSVAIEDLAVGDIVVSHVGPRRVTRTQRTCVKPLSLVSLRLSNGEVIRATGNHPFFTDVGWLPARACGGRRLYRRDCLSHLSDEVHPQAGESARTGAEGSGTVLWTRVSHEGVVPTEARTEDTGPRNDGNAEQRSRGLLELWAAMVRDPSGELSGSDEREMAGTFPGWKWDRPFCHRGSDSASYARRVSMELHRSVGSFWAGLSFPLQAGLWQPGDKSVSGSGWHIPHYPLGEGEGRSEDGAVTVLGVDSSPDNERYGMVPVFNIEIEGAPTYFAGGFLVHNCTRLKSFRLRQGGRRARALAQVAFANDSRFIGLTGTPAPNGLKDLWGQMWYIDKGRRLGATFTAFEQRWFRTGRDGYSIQPMDHAQAEMEELLRDVCLTVRGLPVDDVVENIIYVDLPPKARQMYDDMEKHLFAELSKPGASVTVEASHAGTKYNKCRQIANGFIFDEDRQWHPVHDEKLKALDSIHEEMNGAPLLVSYTYVPDKERILKSIKQARFLDASPATEAAWNRGEIDVLVAHPASAGHGLNLQYGGNTLVDFGVDYNLEHDQQIIERIGPLRQKQAGLDRPVFRHRIIARNTLEEWAILPALKGKGSVQELLLKAMERRQAT